ncbi:MAG TPA: hypothetical protein VH414_18940, partial [Lichenihabitans sp.]|nr:hypothetical protein [Lichenihabitans sp.]
HLPEVRDLRRHDGVLLTLYARDCPVGFRSEDEIAGSAQRLRLTMGSGEDINLDIVQLIERCVGLRFGPNGILSLDIFVWSGHPYHAYVSFDPLNIHVEEETWNHAKWGDPKSRFILAHELGHAVLHDRTAKPFFSR